MNTQIVYVLVSRESDLYLEELWTSLFSLRHFNKDCIVTVLVDLETSVRIDAQKDLRKLINKLIIVDVPQKYPSKERSRYIKTNLRNLIDGDFLFIDTDTVICGPLDDIDSLDVKNIAMVPELHGPFREHLTYKYTVQDTNRIFNVDVTDSPFWFNSGCMLVRDNQFTRDFFFDWNKNWKYSAFKKNNSSDQRALLKTDYDYGYIIECLPDIYNSQVAMSMKWFYDAKIIHFWHFRKHYTPNMDFSPFMSHEIYRALKREGAITMEIANTILNCKSTFRNDSMICGEDEIQLVFSPVNTILWQKYLKGGLTKLLINQIIKILILQRRAKNYMTRLCNTRL